MRHRFSQQPRLPEASLTVPNWPTATIQPGDVIRDILRQFGARGAGRRNLRVQGTDHIHGVDLDGNAAGGADTSRRRNSGLRRSHEPSTRWYTSAAMRPIGWLQIRTRTEPGWQSCQADPRRADDPPARARGRSAAHLRRPSDGPGRSPAGPPGSRSCWTISAAPARQCLSSNTFWTKMINDCGRPRQARRPRGDLRRPRGRRV